MGVLGNYRFATSTLGTAKKNKNYFHSLNNVNKRMGGEEEKKKNSSGFAIHKLEAAAKGKTLFQ